jgi:hypothetical protein
VLHRFVHTTDDAAAPGRDRHTDALGEQLAGDLVAELTHRVPGRAQEADALPVQAIDELRRLGHEPPARPHGVAVELLERVDQDVVVQVAGDRGCAHGQAQGHVRVAHVGRFALHRGVERRNLETAAFASPQRLDATDASHGGLSAVDDGETTNRLHAFGGKSAVKTERCSPFARDRYRETRVVAT